MSCVKLCSILWQTRSGVPQFDHSFATTRGLIHRMDLEYKDDPEALQKAIDANNADTPYRRMKARIPDSIRNNAVTRALFYVSGLVT